MAKANKPANVFRIGYVKATIWLNDDKYYNVVITRSYKKGDDFEDTEQLGHADLHNAAALLQRCEQWISEQ